MCRRFSSFEEQKYIFTMEDERSGEETKDEKSNLLQKRKILDLIGTCSLSLKNMFPSLGRPFHDSHIYDFNKNNK